MSGATISSTSSPDAVRSSSRIRRTRRNERRHGASQPTAAAATVSIPMAPDTNKQESEQELHSDETKLTWDDFFQLLLAFKLEHHHLRIPCDYVTTTPQQIQVRLGQWARYHRSAQFRAREDTSSRDKRDRLKAIGFPFSLREQSWNALFKQLLNFKAKNLHVEVRRKYITPDGVKVCSIHMIMKYATRRMGCLVYE
jgi:Helicase associated domain